MTKAQHRWLLRAQQSGYEQGFVAAPNKALFTLERLGLIEHDPSTCGHWTHWRITDAGQRYAPGA